MPGAGAVHHIKSRHRTHGIIMKEAAKEDGLSYLLVAWKSSLDYFNLAKLFGLFYILSADLLKGLLGLRV
jgi:hypothetical protein